LAEDISVSAEAKLAAGIAFMAKSRLVFLQHDDGGGGSSLAEHESKLRL
jgi:hypothetical protein